jgi:hypothetical protein
VHHCEVTSFLEIGKTFDIEAKKKSVSRAKILIDKKSVLLVDKKSLTTHRSALGIFSINNDLRGIGGMAHFKKYTVCESYFTARTAAAS